MTHEPDNLRVWLLWQDGCRTPSQNMAVDDAMLRHAERWHVPVLRLYSWSEPAVSIGYFQDPPETVNGATVVRRPTGGGTVDHGDDVTYSVLIPRPHPLFNSTRDDATAAIHLALQTGFKNYRLESEIAPAAIGDHPDPATARCFQHPVQLDLMCGRTKVAGLAQRRSRKAVLIQGSIDPSAMPGADAEIVRTAMLFGFREYFSCDFTELVLDDSVTNTATELERTRYSTLSRPQKRGRHEFR